MKPRIKRTIREKVFSVINGEGIVYPQSKVRGKFIELNRREAINRPRCDYWTPSKLIEKVEQSKHLKEQEFKQKINELYAPVQRLKIAIEAIDYTFPKSKRARINEHVKVINY